jgi:hypothetical protein
MKWRNQSRSSPVDEVTCYVFHVLRKDVVLRGEFLQALSRHYVSDVERQRPGIALGVSFQLLHERLWILQEEQSGMLRHRGFVILDCHI